MTHELKAALARIKRKAEYLRSEANGVHVDKYHMEEIISLIGICEREFDIALSHKIQNDKVIGSPLHCPTCGPLSSLAPAMNSRQGTIFDCNIETQVRRRQCPKCKQRFNTVEVSADMFDYHTTWGS